MASAQCCSSSYVDTHRHTKTGRHTGTHTDTHTESHTNIHKRTHTQTQTHTQKRTYTQTRKNAHTHTHKSTHMHAHARTHAHIHFIAHRRSQGRALAQKHTCTSSQRGARAHAETRPRSVPIRIDASTRADTRSPIRAHPCSPTHRRVRKRATSPSLASTPTHNARMLPQRVCLAWLRAVPGRHARVNEQAQKNISPTEKSM